MKISALLILLSTSALPAVAQLTVQQQEGGVINSSGSFDEEGHPQSGMLTDISHDFPNLTCTSTDSGVNEQVFYLARQARSDLAPLLKLDSTWRFPVHIRVINPDDPEAQRITVPRVRITAENNTLNLYLLLPLAYPLAREVLQREIVAECLWEKFFAKTTQFNEQTSLDTAPFWLREGLREWIDDDNRKNHDREEIVLHAAQNKRAPQLKEVLSWRTLSDDTLLSLWQRSFCYYLLKSMIKTQERKAQFQEWLAAVTDPQNTSPKRLFPTEMGWQRELLEADERSHDIIFTWEETKASLEGAQAISFPGKTPNDSRVTTLAKLPTFPREPNLLNALPPKLGQLEELEARAHPSWNHIIEEYRQGLTYLLNEDTIVQATTALAQAEKDRSAELDHHAKIIDYMNWYEVTKDTSVHHTEFPSYFYTAHELEKAEAERPNPIRADLLRTEAKL